MMGRCLVVALFLASVVALSSSVHGAELTFAVSAAEQDYLNALAAPEAAEHAQALDDAFAAIDDNADGMLDQQEMDRLHRQGRLSEAEHTLLQAFDTDGSGSISQAEMTLAPFQLNLLETSVDLDVAADAEFFPYHAPAASQEEMDASAAFDGFAPAPQQQQQARRLKSRVSAEAAEFGEDASLSELSSTVSVAAPVERKGKSAAGGKRGTAPLPVSLFGVPSVADEECVMCQYFVQRIQNGVADRLENGPGATGGETPSGGAGLPGATAEAQKTLKVRNINSQLSKKPGGRGIVRVVAEDVVQALCAVDKMPLLFSPYCSGLAEANAINALRKGVFFNMPTAEVCQQAALCRDDSYLNTNAAVHASKTSLFLNSQRGVCGMLGGSRDRATSREGLILNAICRAHGAVFGSQLPVTTGTATATPK